MNLDLNPEEVARLKEALDVWVMSGKGPTVRAGRMATTLMPLLLRSLPDPAFSLGENGIELDRWELTRLQEQLQGMIDTSVDTEADFAAAKIEDKLEDRSDPSREAAVEGTFQKLEVVANNRAINDKKLAESGSIPWVVATEDAARIAKLAGAKEHQNARSEMIDRLSAPTHRWLPPVLSDRIDDLEDLKSSFPNFSEVIDRICEDLALRLATRAALHLGPLLLLGEPGVGKTAFAATMARLLGFTLHRRSMAETTAGFVLTGSNSRWSGSYHGAITSAILLSPDNTAPLMFLDELDKVRTLDRPATAPLYALLEPESAKAWRDEFLDLEMDVRPISFIFAANDVSAIEAPIRSRLEIVTVPMPTQKQMPAIVRSVDQMLRSEHEGMQHAFAPLQVDIVKKLTAKPPRELRHTLKRAYARCARRMPAGACQRMLEPGDFSD